MVVTVALIVAAVLTGHGHLGNLTSRGVTAHAPGYFGVGGGLMLAMIMGLATLVGFDSAANLAEEARNPYRTVPRAIVLSVTAAGLLGLVFLIALTVAIRDVRRISASGSPVAAIMGDQLGPVMERLLLAAMTFAFFGAGMVIMTACSRIVFAMARDGRFPASRLMRRVDRRTRTPIPATILILAFRKRLGRRAGAFDLGRFELPVAIGALAWSVVSLFVLVTPATAVIPVLIVVGLGLAGGLFLLGLVLADRQALQAQPGDAGAFRDDETSR